MAGPEIDRGLLESRLASVVAARLPGATIRDVQRMHGGNSGLTYSALLESSHSGPERVVVKVAYPGVVPTKNRDVLRQSWLLKHLGGAKGVNVPEVLLEDPGEPPEIPPLFISSFAEGDAFEPTMTRGDGLPSARTVRARELAAVRMLAALHCVDVGPVEMHGERTIGLREELDRWAQVFSTVPEELREGAERVSQTLSGSVPEPMPSVIVHGDYRLGNMLCSGEAISAVVDWEIWSLGDPRVDLGWFLMNTHPSKQPTAVRAAPGMPSDEELIGAYEAEAGVRLEHLDWFDALNRYKAAAITAQIIKHNRRRSTPDEFIESWASYVPQGYLDGAEAVLSAARLTDSSPQDVPGCKRSATALATDPKARQ